MCHSRDESSENDITGDVLISMRQNNFKSRGDDLIFCPFDIFHFWFPVNNTQKDQH